MKHRLPPGRWAQKIGAAAREKYDVAVEGVRTVSLAPFAVTKLREHRARQNRERLLAGDLV